MGVSPFSFISLFMLISICFPFSSSKSYNLRAGSSLSVQKPADVLISQNGIFSAGFFQVGRNAYCFAIWFTEPSQSHNLTVVWMANREEPVNGRRSRLELRRSGNLVLTDAGQSAVWSSDTAASSSNFAAELQLWDTGNLALVTEDDAVLWQSFSFPTNTLLPGQSLTRNTMLVSSRSQTNYYSGFYKLLFDNDNVLRLLFDGPQISSFYWPDPWLLSWQAGRSVFNDSRIAKIDSLGNFSSSDTYTALASDYGTQLQRRMTVEPDGNLRLYSRKRSGDAWIITWEAVLQPCKIHGICGANSVCSYVPEFGRKCSCIPGYKMINRSDWTQGCEPDFKLSCANSTTESAGFALLPRVEFYGYDYTFYQNQTLESCKSRCLELCDACVGFHYKYDSGGGRYNCYPKLQLRNGYHTPGFDGDIYLKLPKTILSSLPNSATNEGLNNLGCSASSIVMVQLDRRYEKTHVSGLVKFLLWFACGVGGLEIFVIFTVWFFVMRGNENSGEDNLQDYVLAATGFKKFSYAELKKATRGFSEEIGSGAGGVVYIALLSDKRVAAVKKLKDTSQGEVEFLAEVSIIGRLNHMNLIETWGYCAEGKHRILVYEFMEHGSLAENLASNVLDWKKRFEIAVGTAKGLAYLHDECLEWVLHCDVKPQNILLGSNYQPKVADFGLSKLQNRSELGRTSSFSRIRGTRGYMAPEWVYNLPITSKVDVYSYGIVVLELLTGNNPTRVVHDGEDHIGDQARPKMLVTWVREKIAGSSSIEAWIEEIVDPLMEGQYKIREVEILVQVALQCVEEDRDARPTMRQVVEMLLSHENEYY